MMNTKHSKLALMVASGALTVALSGCGGDDGNPGNPGNPGGPAASSVAQLHLDVTDISHSDNNTTVTVFATNEKDMPVVGLKDFNIKKIAQLIPQGATGAGNAAQWQAIYSLPRGTAQMEYTDNKDGSYSFVVPVEGYNPELTQRFNIIVGAGTLLDQKTPVPRTEYTEDLASDGSDAKTTKNVVAGETCNTCHTDTKAIYHSYTDLDTCITCHNDELAASRGNEAGFNHLIHNVHNSAKPWGKDDAKDAVAAHAIVQDNCQTCHIQPADDNHQLAEWGNWSAIPTMETCSSCHTDIDFKAGKGHPAQSDNSNCIACHNASWTEEIHLMQPLAKKQLIDSHLLSASMSTTQSINGNTPVKLEVALTDKQGNPIDLSTVKYVESFTNIAPNFPKLAYGKHEIDEAQLVIDGKLNEELIDRISYQDGKLFYQSNPLPFDAIGTDGDTAINLISAAICIDATHTAVKCEPQQSKFASLNAVTSYATIGDEIHQRQASSVNKDTCINCHGDAFEIHNSFSEYVKHAGIVMNQLDDLAGCVTCHAPHGTYANGVNKGALEMKLHKTHKEKASHGLIGGSCSQCHTDFNLEAFSNKGAMATDSVNENWQWNTTGYSSPVTAVCTSCHVPGEPFVSLTKQHIDDFGGTYNGLKGDADAGTETCLLCHKPTIANHGAVQM